ncbi:MAG: UDP-N-acetylmuramoyl-L-alanine--D-glutamate ligase [Gammaproteobacteria bacterium]|nr:UDP-N-acetylmuramoyl-L-alanine--D-glutamate ligase [Gammaproteobacteria bacterium]
MSKLSHTGIDVESRIVIVGMGVTGLSVLRYLVDLGITPVIIDTREQPDNLQQIIEIQRRCPALEFATGKKAINHVCDATHVVVSPGISLKTPQLQHAREQGSVILGDIDIFALQATAPVIAITGSNGKSTVTTLVGKMIEATNHTVAVGGNIGTPALDLLSDPEPDFYVLELSSFQLECISHLRPAASVVLNISADHMDRYESLQEYTSAKLGIYEHAQVIVENGCDELAQSGTQLNQTQTRIRYGLSDDTGCSFRTGFIEGQEWILMGNQPLIPCSEVALQGRHNISNSLAALALVDAVRLDIKTVLPVLRQFSGLPHRMQLVSQTDDIKWFNDSKATNIGACQAALQGLSEPVILIAGGDAKGADFSEFATQVSKYIKYLIVLGKDAEKISTAFNRLVNIECVDTIDQAVLVADRVADAGDTVLLSPACASLDQFKNYQARGDAFVQAVQRLSA